MTENLNKVPEKTLEGGSTVKQETGSRQLKDKEYTLEVIEDWDAKHDVFHIPNPDTKYKYRFLRYDPRNLTMKTHNLLLQRGGWQVVSKEHALRIGMKDGQDIFADGMTHRGDQVLYFMPMELYEKKLAYQKKVNQAPMDAIERLIKQGDPNNPELSGLGHQKQKGLQTAKDLGMD